MQSVELARPIVAERVADAQQQERKVVSDPPQIRALTGLRFLPLIIICWHHARDYWVPMKGLFEEAFAFKHFVTLFFVLSGFILAYRYNYVKDVGTSLHFYLARIARLWPMHVFCLFLLLGLMPDVFTTKGEYAPVFWCNFLMVHSWIPITKYYFSFNAPSWSSATLSFFDLAFPFLFIGAKRSKWLVLVIPALFTLNMIWLCNVFNMPIDSQNAPSIHGMTYINGWSRLLEFATGVVCALAYLRFHERMSKLPRLAGTALEAVALALVVFVGLNSRTWFVALQPHLTKAGAFWFHNSGDCLIPMAIFITVLAMERGVVSKFFASKPMAILGDMSFALYMLHAVFIAYFNTHFHEEYVLYPAIFFFGSLLFAAHIMHTSIVQPMRFQFLKWGTKLIELKYPAPPKPPKRQKTAAQIRNKRLLLAGEIAACATLLYFAFPTIQRISPAEAATLSAQATTHDVQFDPWIACKSGVAHATKGTLTADGQTIATQEVTVDTIWQALKSEPVDFYITARVLDDQGKVLALSRYQMDGRFQHVGAGNCWKDMVHIAVDGNAKPATVAIKITHGKRKEIAPHSDVPAQIQGKEMIVPVGL